MKRGYVDTPHGQIHYRTEGSGEAILFLHLTPTSSADYVKVLPILGKKYRAIAMDTLGYGNSDKPRRRYAIPDYVQSVIDFLDGLGIEKVTMAGFHTGSGIAAYVAAMHPDRVNKLIVSGYTYYSQIMLDERIRGNHPAYIRVIEPLSITADGSYLTHAWTHVKEFFLGPDAPLDELHKMTLDVLKAGTRSDEAHLTLWGWADQHQPEKYLPTLKCPTLIIISPKDLFYWGTMTVKSWIPRSKVKVIGEDAPSFYLPVVAHDKFAKEIMDFMENPSA